MRRHPLLEQLVEAAIRQLPARPCQPVQLEPQLLVGQQGLPVVVRVRVGRDQRQRGVVIAGDPGGGRGVKHLGPVPQPQRGPAVLVHHPDPQYRAAGQVAVPGRVEQRRERRPRHSHLASQVLDRHLGVAQQLAFRPGRLRHETSPRACLGCQPARQHPVACGDVPGHDVPLTRQRRQDHRVRGEQRRARRHSSPRQRHRALADARYRVEGPPRDHRGPAGGQHPPPVLLAGLRRHLHQVLTSVPRSSSLSRRRSVVVAQSSSLLLVVEDVVAWAPVDADEVAAGDVDVVVARGVVVVVRCGVVVARRDVVVARCFAFAEVDAFADVDPGRFAGAVDSAGPGVVVSSAAGPDVGALDGGGVVGRVTPGTADAAAAGRKGTGTPMATAVPPDSARTSGHSGQWRRGRRQLLSTGTRGCGQGGRAGTDDGRPSKTIEELDGRVTAPPGGEGRSPRLS